MRDEARRTEENASRFYREAAARATDAPVRKLPGGLAVAELDHLRSAGKIKAKRLPGDKRLGKDDDARRRFVLQIV